MTERREHRCVDCGSRNIAQVPETPSPNKHKGGRVPWGFEAVNGEYRFDSVTGPMLTLLLRWRAEGGTYREIAQVANSPFGFEAPSGGQWSHGSVRRVIAQGKKLSHLIPLSFVI